MMLWPAARNRSMTTASSGTAPASPIASMATWIPEVSATAP